MNPLVFFFYFGEKAWGLKPSLIFFLEGPLGLSPPPPLESQMKYFIHWIHPCLVIASVFLSFFLSCFVISFNFVPCMLLFFLMSVRNSLEFDKQKIPNTNLLLVSKWRWEMRSFMPVTQKNRLDKKLEQIIEEMNLRWYSYLH